MAKMNYADIANKIIAQIGEENVLTVSHCMTRLRFTVKDFSKVSLDDIQKISGVIGAVYHGEQVQVIMGQHLLATYNEIVKQGKFREEAAVDENLDAPAQEMKGIKGVVN